MSAVAQGLLDAAVGQSFYGTAKNRIHIALAGHRCNKSRPVWWDMDEPIVRLPTNWSAGSTGRRTAQRDAGRRVGGVAGNRDTAGDAARCRGSESRIQSYSLSRSHHESSGEATRSETRAGGDDIRHGNIGSTGIRKCYAQSAAASDIHTTEV